MERKNEENEEGEREKKKKRNNIDSCEQLCHSYAKAQIPLLQFVLDFMRRSQKVCESNQEVRNLFRAMDVG